MTFDRLRHLLAVTRELPLWKRYLAAVAIVAVATLIRSLLDPYLDYYPYFIFLGAVTICGLLLNSFTSMFAAILSAVIVTLLFVEPRFSLALEAPDMIALFVFLLTSLLIAGAAEALRILTDSLDQAERQKDLLLTELHHRTRNNLQIITSLINMQSAESDNPAVRDAMRAVAERVITIGRLNHYLLGPAMEELQRIEAKPLLEDICADMQISLVGQRPIAIVSDASPITIDRDTAGTLAIALNELITNALKHGFAADRPGMISVTLRKEDDTVTLTVSDDGEGCPELLQRGSGLNLLRALVARHGGSIEHRSTDPGCRATLRLPSVG